MSRFVYIFRSGSQYSFEELSLFGLAKKYSLEEILRNNPYPAGESDEKRLTYLLLFVLNLLRCLKSTAQGSIPLKELTFQTLVQTAPTLANCYERHNRLVDLMQEQLSEIKRDHAPGTASYNEAIDLAISRAERTASAPSAGAPTTSVKIEEILPLSAGKLKEETETVLQKAHEPAAWSQEILTSMHRMLTDGREADLVEELGAVSNAWRVANLRALRPLIEASATPDEKTKVAERIAQSFNEKKSSIFILPLSHLVGLDSFINKLQVNGIRPIQLVQQKQTPEGMVKPIFYRILNPEKKEVGYLLGTAHYASRKMLELNPAIHDALNASGSVYLEIAPKEDDPRGVRDDLRALLQTESSTLSQPQKERLNQNIEKAFPIICRLLQERGAQAATIERLQLDFTHATPDKRIRLYYELQGQLLFHEAGLALMSDGLQLQQVSIEDLLLVHAATTKKPTYGLENDDPQRTALIKKSLGLNFEIDAMPEEPEAMERHLRDRLGSLTKLCESWKTGDRAWFEHFSSDFESRDPELFKQFAIDRNKKMAESIVEALKKSEHPAFFGVGTLHLVSKENVVTLLQEQGYQLEPVIE